MTEVKRVLVVSAKAGAGHLRAAEAVESAVRETYPDVEVRNLDALEYTNVLFRKNFTGLYHQLVKRLPSVWGMIYGSTERRSANQFIKKLSGFVDRLNTRALRKAVRKYDPDAVICTHYLPAEVFAVQRRKGTLRASVSIVLTDYDIHPMWVQGGADRYFVATEEMAHALRVKGIGDATAHVSGIPVLSQFTQSYPDRTAMREQLGLRPTPKTVLMAAGGFGMVKVDELVAMLADAVDDVQFLVIAGRNKKLEKSLRTVADARPGKIVPFGFVSNMHELMAASDFMVTKCGGLTSTECLVMSVPMIIVNPIPGQEERNADFLLESGAALRANSPAHLLFKVRKLLDNPSLLTQMRDAASRVAHPRAAYDIAQAVCEG